MSVVSKQNIYDKKSFSDSKYRNTFDRLTLLNVSLIMNTKNQYADFLKIWYFMVL